MEIRIANCAGACFGVNRALDIVRGAMGESQRAFTLGPLIHNPIVVGQLAQGGVDVAENLDDVPQGSIVIIRSHGVAPSVIEDAKRRGLTVLDATCPHVKRAQNAAAKLADKGYRVVVVGEKGHPEVEAICACAGDDVIVASSRDDIPAGMPAKVGVVVQTTQTRATLDEVLAALSDQGCELELEKTICAATRVRQDAAAELAGQADVMLVIGGRNSGNTRRLASICSAVCPRTHHIESPDELDPAWFEGARLVGITAGASTPEDHIHAVVAALEGLK